MANAWEEYYSLPNTAADPNQLANKLKQLAEKYPNTDIALWTRLDLADHLCAEGKTKLETDREIGMTRLLEAEKTYVLVLENPRVLPEMIRRGAVAHAKCWELMGDRVKAIEAYQLVSKKYAKSHPETAKEAASLASELEQPAAADFYRWLAEYKPTSSTPLSPFMPDLSFPPLRTDKEKSDGTDDGVDSSKPAEPPEAKTDEPKGSDDQPQAKNETEKPDDSAKKNGDKTDPEQPNPKE